MTTKNIFNLMKNCTYLIQTNKKEKHVLKCPLYSYNFVWFTQRFFFLNV